MTRLLVLMICVASASCRSRDHVPGDVLPREKMERVMWDMMRADQFLANFVFTRDTAANKLATSLAYYTKVLALHNVTREQFETSFDYYKSRPELFRNLMDTLMSPRFDSSKSLSLAVDTTNTPFHLPEGQRPLQPQRIEAK